MSDSSASHLSSLFLSFFSLHQKQDSYVVQFEKNIHLESGLLSKVLKGRLKTGQKKKHTHTHTHTHKNSQEPAFLREPFPKNNFLKRKKKAVVLPIFILAWIETLKNLVVWWEDKTYILPLTKSISVELDMELFMEDYVSFWNFWKPPMVPPA